jgi:hypothetical protein
MFAYALHLFELLVHRGCSGLRPSDPPCFPAGASLPQTPSRAGGSQISRIRMVQLINGFRLVIFVPPRPIANTRAHSVRIAQLTRMQMQCACANSSMTLQGHCNLLYCLHTSHPLRVFGFVNFNNYFMQFKQMLF